MNKIVAFFQVIIAYFMTSGHPQDMSYFLNEMYDEKGKKIDKDNNISKVKDKK